MPKTNTTNKKPEFTVETTTTGIYFSLDGYDKLKESKWDRDMVFRIDGVEKVITFEEFEKAIDM